MTVSSIVGAGAGCDPVQEAPRVTLPLVVGPVELEASATTDLGYEVTLAEARLVAGDFEFTTAGELHAGGKPSRFWDVLVPPAWAHPGHYEGGEIIGEARGRFLVDFAARGEHLGSATLIIGNYTSANFTFALGEQADGLDADDPLLGHTAHFVGTASKDGHDVTFDILIDSPEDRVLIGAPFEAEVTEDSENPIAFELLIHDQLGGGTLFDGVDFTALDADANGAIELAPTATDTDVVDAYNQVRRAFQTHNHYGFRLLAATVDP